MSKTTRISYSGVDTFKECPKKYWCQRTHKLALQPSAFAFGSAFESGADEMLLNGAGLADAYEVACKEWHTRPANKWEGETQIFDNPKIFYYQSDFDANLLDKDDVKQCQEWGKEIFEQEVEAVEIAINTLKKMKSGADISDDERKLTHRILWLCCKNRMYYMLKAFQEELVPEIEEVIAAQHEINLENEEGDKVTGFVDYKVRLKSVEGITILDLKSAGRPYEEHRLNTSDQLGIYAVAEKADNIAYGVVLKKIQYHVTCNKCGGERQNYRKSKCEHCDTGRYTEREPYSGTQLMVKSMTEHHKESVTDDFSEILVAIKNGVSWKNSHSCENYGTRCEFYDHCWGGKSLDELDSVEKKEEK